MKEDERFSDPLADNAKREKLALAARDASLMEGAKGSLYASIFAVGSHFAGNHFVPQYRAVNFRLKTFLWSSFVVCAFWVRSEQEQLRQLRVNYGYEGHE